MLPPYTLQVWGIVSFIEIGFATTIKLIFEINSTLSFCAYTNLKYKKL